MDGGRFGFEPDITTDDDRRIWDAFYAEVH